MTMEFFLGFITGLIAFWFYEPYRWRQPSPTIVRSVNGQPEERYRPGHPAYIASIDG